MEIPIVVAIISAATAIVAAIVSAAAQRGVKRVEQRFEDDKRSFTFRSDQLARLYLPVSMHLQATRALATTHYKADAATRKEIEHALHEHHKLIVECLMTSSMYLEPGAPDAASVGLLGHLLQWETLHKLKYQSKPAFSVTIWEEIRRLGYNSFPDQAAEHFHTTAARIRTELHGELKAHRSVHV